MNRWQELSDGRRVWMGYYHGRGVEVYIEPSRRRPGLWCWALGIDRLLFEPWTVVGASPVDSDTAIREAFARLRREVLG